MDLAELKRKHRLVFCTEIAGRLIYWRALTLREHDIYTKIIEFGLSPIGKVQDLIFREICLDPSVIDQMNLTPAGLIPSIVNTALTISGNSLRNNEDLDRINNDLQEMREVVHNSPFEQFFVIICKAFPTYTPSELEQLEYQEILRLLIMAEQILKLENPLKLEVHEEKNLTDRLFKDRSQAEQADRGAPSATDIRDILAAKQEDSIAIREAKKIEMERRLRQRQSQKQYSRR